MTRRLAFIFSMAVLTAVAVSVQPVRASDPWPEDKPWPAEPASAVRVLRLDDGSSVRVYRNEWGYEVRDYGGGRRSITAPRNLVQAPGPGRPTAKHYRDQGFVFVDRLTGDSIRRIAPCVYEISYVGREGRRVKEKQALGCLIQPVIRASVESLGDGRFRYSYTFANEENAEQRIKMVQIELPGRDVVTDEKGARGWRPRLVDRGVAQVDPAGRADLSIKPVIAWSPYPSSSAKLTIAPGGEVQGLSFTSSYLPGLTEGFFFGLTASGNGSEPAAPGLPEHLAAAFEEIVAREESVSRAMIGPRIAPPGADPEDRVVVLDRLVSEFERARRGGLLRGEQAERIGALLAEARGSVSDADLLEAVAKRAEEIRDLDPGYRSAVTVALRALAGA